MKYIIYAISPIVTLIGGLAVIFGILYLLVSLGIWGGPNAIGWLFVTLFLIILFFNKE